MARHPPQLVGNTKARTQRPWDGYRCPPPQGRSPASKIPPAAAQDRTVLPALHPSPFQGQPRTGRTVPAPQVLRLWEGTGDGPPVPAHDCPVQGPPAPRRGGTWSLTADSLLSSSRLSRSTFCFSSYSSSSCTSICFSCGEGRPQRGLSAGGCWAPTRAQDGTGSPPSSRQTPKQAHVAARAGAGIWDRGASAGASQKACSRAHPHPRPARIPWAPSTPCGVITGPSVGRVEQLAQLAKPARAASRLT